MSTHQASQPPQAPQSTPGVGTFLSDAVSLLQDDPRIVLVTVVGGALSAIPIVGTFLNFLVVGFAHVLAQQSLDAPVTDDSLAKRFVFLVIGGILYVIAVAIGFIFLIIPGIYLALRFSLMIPAIMTDGHGPIDGLSESWERAGGNLLTIFGFQIIVLLVTLVAVLPLFAVFGLDATLAPVDTVASLAQGIVSGAIGAVSVGGLVLMYRAFGDSRGRQAGGQPYQGGQQQYQGGQQQGGHQRGGNQRGGRGQQNDDSQRDNQW